MPIISDPIIIIPIIIVLGGFILVIYNNLYDKDGYNQKGFNRRGFNSSGVHKNGTNYDDSGFDALGFNENGIHLNGTKYGYNGYDINGRDRKGLDDEGYSEDGYNLDGFDRYGYDREGFNAHGFNKEGYNQEGFDKRGVAWWHKRDGADSNVNESTFNQLVTINHIPKVENDLIIGNAFLTLGLDNFSSIKSITKRTKEIERLLKIDTIPKYDKDIYYLPLIRGHLDVKNAIKNLTDLQNKIIESFFWFDIQDEKDEKNYTLLQEGKIVAACWHWNEKYVQNNDYLALKNLIIAEMMYLTISGSINILRNTLEDWKLIINNEKFWDDFNKRFQDNDEFGTDIQQLRSFKNEVINLLGEYYFRISDAWENDKIITSFISIFGVIPKNLRDTKATPLFKKIYDINKKIHSMYSDDNKSGLTSISNITIIIEKYSKDINDVLSELYRYGLKDDYELRDLCEDSGQAIRNLAINILNTMDAKQYQDTRALAETLLKKSKEYATSFVLQEQIQRDIRDLKRQKMLEAEMKRVEIEVKNNNFDNAQKILLKIVETESNIANKRFFVEQLLVLRKAELNQLFKKYIKSKNYSAAEKVIDVMIEEETDSLQRMELFKVKRELSMMSPLKYR